MYLKVLLQVHFKYFAFKDRYYSKIIQMALKHILGLILRNVHCAQVACQKSITIIFISVTLEFHLSVNMLIDFAFACILNILLFY